nr:MAG TPA: hypothetical protein [Caudoviricetes sp.]
MAQQTLSVEINGEVVVSKPFDFESMCLIDDARNSNEKNGILRLGIGAVSYLFEGTVATDQEIKKLPVQKRAALSQKVWRFYIETLNDAAKND